MPNDPAGRQEGSADARSSKGSLEVSPLARAESRIDKRSFTTFTTFTGPGESEVDPDEGEVSPLGGETGETGETCRTYAENVSDGGEPGGETLDESHGEAEEQETETDAIERDECAGVADLRKLASLEEQLVRAARPEADRFARTCAAWATMSKEEDRAVSHEQLVKEKREEILRIASRHGARATYGSSAPWPGARPTARAISIFSWS